MTEQTHKQMEGKEDCPLCKVPEDSIKILKNESMNQQSKKSEYDRKKQEKEKEYADKDNMKKFQKTAIVVVSVALVVGGLSFVLAKQFFNGNGKEGSSGAPVMEVTPKEYEAGTISMAAGVVKYTYKIENKGDGELKINNIKTSCHCTTAKLKIGDNESPSFGMDSTFSSWTGKIPGGGEGLLEVTFDPAYHGSSGVGAAIRAIYFSTNDPNNKKSEVRLSANVTP